jgi:hypothetical protein
MYYCKKKKKRERERGPYLPHLYPIIAQIQDNSWSLNNLNKINNSVLGKVII